MQKNGAQQAENEYGLPVFSSSLIGRALQVQEVCDLCLHAEGRLVSLTGCPLSTQSVACLQKVPFEV